MQTGKENIDALTREFMNSPEGNKISAKESELKKLSESRDGKKIKEMLEPNSEKLMTAVEKGDTAELKKTIQGIINTDEGARLIKQLSDMFK